MTDQAPTKQLWHVTLAVDAIIVADTREQAESIARGLRYDLARESDFDVENTMPMDHFPSGWEPDSIPHGYHDPEDPDRTVAAWLDLGAAPVYTKRWISWRRSENGGKGRP